MENIDIDFLQYLYESNEYSISIPVKKSIEYSISISALLKKVTNTVSNTIFDSIEYRKYSISNIGNIQYLIVWLCLKNLWNSLYPIAYQKNHVGQVSIWQISLEKDAKFDEKNWKKRAVHWKVEEYQMKLKPYQNIRKKRALSVILRILFPLSL